MAYNLPKKKKESKKVNTLFFKEKNMFLCNKKLA